MVDQCFVDYANFKLAARGVSVPVIHGLNWLTIGDPHKKSVTIRPDGMAEQEIYSSIEKAVSQWPEGQGEAICLRDRFAMAALTGMMAADHDGGEYFKHFAQQSYAMADAMMKAREA